MRSNRKSASLRSKSNIVLGHQPSSEYEENMRTTYHQEIGLKSKEFIHNPQSKQASVKSRNDLRDTMRGTSVTLGSDGDPRISHYDSEFRHVKYDAAK
jgi:hypothetical protein